MAGSRKRASTALRKLYEWADILIDFVAALTFLVGSVCFFYDGEIKLLGVWLFVIGSVLFGIKPALKIFRGLRYGIEDQMAKQNGPHIYD